MGDAKGNRLHFVMEEGCYVLFLENPAGIATRSFWILPEAFKMLRTLPVPTKAPQAESELERKCRLFQSLYGGPTAEADDLVDVICGLMSEGLKRQLRQLCYSGPLFAGDVVSPKDRDHLIRLGLATLVVSKGEEGHSAATTLGWVVFKTLKMEVLAG